MCHPQAPATRAVLATLEKVPRAQRPFTRSGSSFSTTALTAPSLLFRTSDPTPPPPTPLRTAPAACQGGDVALRKMRQERGERLAREYHTQSTAETKRREHDAAEAAAAAIAAKAAAEEHETKVQEELETLRARTDELQVEVDKFRAEKEVRDKAAAEEAAAKAAAAEAKGGKGKGKKK